MKLKKRIGIWAAVVLAAGVMTSGCEKKEELPTQESAASEAAVSEGTADTAQYEEDGDRIMLDFSSIEAVDQNGKEFAAKDFAGKDVTVINVWGTFCAPCIQEMPDLEAFRKKLPEHVQLITLCVDGSGAPEDAKKILESTGFEGTSLLAGNDAFAAVCNEILSVPLTVFVDKDGRMIGDGHYMDDIFDGGMDGEDASAGVILGGGMENLEEVYLRAVNRALRTIGKEEISLAE